MRAIVPVADLGSRMPEHGRIRLGVKTGRAMKSIDTFRFTSTDHKAIIDLAEQYGGTPKAWDDPKAAARNQLEVVTTTSEFDVFLPPGALSTWYETWAGGGVTKRCDGITAEVPSRGQEEMVSVPCVCGAEQNMTCRPYTRLNVILPTIRFGGVWRLETKGWNAAAEMPGMEEALQSLQANGLVQARLSLQQRQAKGGSKRFVVPVLSMAHSPNEILAGKVAVGQLNPAPTGTPSAGVIGARITDLEGRVVPGAMVPLAIEAPVDPPPARTASSTAWYDDDEVIEGEVVGEPDLLELIDRVMGQGDLPNLTGDLPVQEVRSAVAFVASDGKVLDVDGLDEGSVRRATKALREILVSSNSSRMAAILRKYEGRPL